MDSIMDTLCAAPLMSVYCACGRIVELDSEEMRLKMALGKDLQCVLCRSQRISEEIEMLNRIYDGIPGTAADGL